MFYTLKKFFTLSNSLSCLRAPLALLFFSENTSLRLTAVILAMITDSIDGYFARKFHQASLAGAIVDPLMDKFFVYFVLWIFLKEGRLETWQALTFLSRDFALCIYGLYVSLTQKWSTIVWRAIRFGKLTTALQFFLIIALIFSLPLPYICFWIFILLGVFALVELLVSEGNTV